MHEGWDTEVKSFSLYFLTEENLQQLHEIHDCIQRMRDLTLSTLGYSRASNSNTAQMRLTSSCPTLCQLIATELAPRPGNHDTGSDPELLANCSTNSSPTHFPGSTSHSRSQQAQTGIDRRRSWTGDLEDLEESRRSGRRRYSGQNHLQAQNMVNIACYLLEPEVGAGSISVSSRFDAEDLDATKGYVVVALVSRINPRNRMSLCPSQHRDLNSSKLHRLQRPLSQKYTLYSLNGDGMALSKIASRCCLYIYVFALRRGRR